MCAAHPSVGRALLRTFCAVEIPSSRSSTPCAVSLDGFVELPATGSRSEACMRSSRSATRWSLDSEAPELAHGDMYMVGAFIGFGVLSLFGGASSPSIALLPLIVLMFVAAMLGAGCSES